MTFQSPEYWPMLVAVLLLAVLMIVGYALTRRALRHFAAAPMLARLVPTVVPWRRLVKLVAVAATLVLLVVSLADPRWGSVWVERKQKGADVVFALDVSRSMLADDVSPTRLSRAKQFIDEMTSAMGGDRVALVTFAGDARQRVPLTGNFSDLKMTLDEVGPHDVTRGGSKLGDAIRTAEGSFVDDEKGSKAIVIITDGEDQDSFPVEAARTAYKEKGIRVFTVGLGDAAKGSHIPIRQVSGNAGYVMHDGTPVVTKMDGHTLKQTALAGGGAYIPAGASYVNMADVYHRYISNLTQREFDSARVEHLIPRFQWFAGAALALLLLDTLVSDFRRPRPRPRKGGFQQFLSRKPRVDAGGAA